MRMGYGIYQEQSQKLMMTPELRLAIKILQFSAVELAEHIQQELAENPVLEIKEELNEATDEGLLVESPAESAVDEKYDMDWQEYFADTSDLGFQQGMSRDRTEDIRYENIISQAPTLQEQLISQLSLGELDQLKKKVGEYLIGNIDENGYLQASLEEAAAKFSVTLSEVENILRYIQSFEPWGVGARNLVECLLIQAEHLKVPNYLVQQIIQSYLPEVAKGKISKVAQELGVSLNKVQQALDTIKTLDPKPGRNFSSLNEIKYIVPDVFIERIEGEYVIIVNDTSVPRLIINNSYKDLLKKDAGDEAKEFIEQKLHSAVWLIRSIEQRRLTLYRVAQSLVELQREFFDKGIRYLKPLNLKQVAQKLDIHESTVSRATSNKYAQTPQGLFELKFFFTSGVENRAGGMTSAESVKKTIADLIGQEDTKSPLSDQKICDLLNARGINISRRTVAKYRDEMGVPAATLRKRYE